MTKAKKKKETEKAKAATEERVVKKFFRYYNEGRVAMAVIDDGGDVYLASLAFCNPKDQTNKKLGRKIAMDRLEKKRMVLPIAKKHVGFQESIYGALAYIAKGLFAQTQVKVREAHAAHLGHYRAESMERLKVESGIVGEEATELVDKWCARVVRGTAYNSVAEGLGMPQWFLRCLVKTSTNKVESVPITLN